MEKSTYVFPEGTITCNRGDYILLMGDTNRWSVHLVEDIVLISRLVPLNFPHGIEYMEEKDVLDTARAELCLLVASYAKEFSSKTDASDATKRKDLGPATSSVCIRASHLLESKTAVIRSQVIEAK